MDHSITYFTFEDTFFQFAGAGLQPFFTGAAVLLCYWLILFWMYRLLDVSAKTTPENLKPPELTRYKSLCLVPCGGLMPAQFEYYVVNLPLGLKLVRCP